MASVTPSQRLRINQNYWVWNISAQERAAIAHIHITADNSPEGCGVRSQILNRIVEFGYQLNAGQFKVKPVVVSLSNHKRLDRSPFDKLRANG